MTTPAFDPAQATRAYIDSLGPEALQRAADYTTGNHWMLLVGLIVTGVVAWLIVRLGWLTAIERRFEGRPKRGVFLVGLTYFVLSALFSLPWTVYSAWWRELHYERSSQPLGDFLSQSLLGTAIDAVFIPAFLVLLYVFIRRVPRTWWLWGGGLTAVFIALLLLLVPAYLMPLFNDYQPLPPGEVRDAVEVLADEAGIPRDRIFMYDGSRQSNNFTANVSGFGPSARIAISDVALGEASMDEVKAVTGHEIGHYVLGHVWNRVITAALLSMLFFYVISRSFPVVAGWFGADRDIARASGMPVLLFLVAVLGTLAEPINNGAIRAGENAADQYSLDAVGLPDALATALLKTAEYRYPRPAAWEEFLFYTHPSVERRVRHAMDWKAANTGGNAAQPSAQRAGDSQ